MKKQSSIILGLVLLGSLLLGATVLAGPLPPDDKVIKAPSGKPYATAEPSSSSASVRSYLRNGAFDEQWEGNVPQFWTVYPGDADDYGPLSFLSSDAAHEMQDEAFVLQINNDEVESDRNAYVYQELTLPAGDYWINVHLAIYGTGSGVPRSSGDDTPDAYTYMAYYALVPRSEVMQDGSFTPAMVSAEDWKELWPWATVCSEEVKGWRTGKPGECDYVMRAEAVSVVGGEHVFILRAELKWPDWRAFANYVFDDTQIIPATPNQVNWSPCVTSFCLEGLLQRR
jgi:hypothetical protein